jgi:hypothetical protein
LLGYIAGIEWKLRDDASDEQNTTASTDIQDDGLAEVESS